MTRYQAMRELIQCAKSRLDEIQLQSKMVSDGDSASALAEDFHNLSRAVDRVTNDPLADAVAQMTLVGEFARAVSVVRNRLLSMHADELPDPTHPSEATVKYLEQVVEDDLKFAQFTSQLEGKR